MTTGPAGPAGGDDPHPPQAHGQPGHSGAGAVPGSPAAPDQEEVDVLHLAGQRPRPEGDWLLATEVDGTPGGQFTAHVLAEAAPSAFGGDVVVHLAPDDPPADQPPLAARVQVYAVMGGRLIPVAA